MRAVGDKRVVVYQKGEERYVFVFHDEDLGGVTRQLGRFASNPELSFTWYDVAILTVRIGKELSCESD